MKTYKVSRLLVIVTVAFWSLFSGRLLFADIVKKPMVAIIPIESADQRYSYVGSAVTEMLVTRLSSEGIDSFIIGDPDKQKVAVELADFLLTGSIDRSDNVFDAKLFLKEPGKGEILKEWNIMSATLDSFAQETALFSAKLSDTIKHAEEVLIKNSAEGSVSSNPSKDGLELDNDFAVARMHPDKLVRIQLEGQAEEHRQDKLAEQMRQLRQQQDVLDRSKKGTPEQWDPLPDVYNPATDEEPVYKEETAGPEKAGGISRQAGSSRWSLWPFSHEGKRDNMKPGSSNNDVHGISNVVADNRLPYPPPPNINFHVPEPVPLEEALKKIEPIQTDRSGGRKDNGWFSWLWPQEQEPEIAGQKQASLTKPEGHEISAGEEEKAGPEGIEKPSVPERPTHFDGPIWQWY